MTPRPSHPALTNNPPTGVAPISGWPSGVSVYWPACTNHVGPRSQIVRQNGVTRATDVGLDGSSTANGNAGSGVTGSAGGVGGVRGSVNRIEAPPNAGRQCAPVSSSIVIGASVGTLGS